jgi:hypothetical protein
LTRPENSHRVSTLSAASTIAISNRENATATPTHDQRDHEQDQEDDEQDLRDPRRGAGEAPEAEAGRDDRNEKENECPSEHEILQSGGFSIASVPRARAIRFRSRMSEVWRCQPGARCAVATMLQSQCQLAGLGITRLNEARRQRGGDGITAAFFRPGIGSPCEIAGRLWRHLEPGNPDRCRV